MINDVITSIRHCRSYQDLRLTLAAMADAIGNGQLTFDLAGWELISAAIIKKREALEQKTIVFHDPDLWRKQFDVLNYKG